MKINFSKEVNFFGPSSTLDWI